MIGIVLLSADGFYATEDGKLPPRPWFDRQLLDAITTNAICVASDNTYANLPDKLKLCTNTYSCVPIIPTVNLGISTFKGEHQPDIFIISRSKDWLVEGKKFDMAWLNNEYVCISDNDNMLDSASIWIKRT